MGILQCQQVSSSETCSSLSPCMHTLRLSCSRDPCSGPMNEIGGHGTNGWTGPYGEMFTKGSLAGSRASAQKKATLRETTKMMATHHLMKMMTRVSRGGTDSKIMERPMAHLSRVDHWLVV